MIKQPLTPNLDKLSEVHERSDEIGDFVVEFLRSKGILLAEWKEIREPCWRRTKTTRPLFYPDAGTTIEYTDDPFACDCEPTDGMDTPHTHREMVLVNRERVIQPLLAEYFGIDYPAIETERRALLDYVRAQTAEAQP
jgi:hypothetical protein